MSEGEVYILCFLVGHFVAGPLTALLVTRWLDRRRS